ncbi:MAG: hypothetical protein K2K94_08675, partial [Muribaculaceae bacterium]|nr:hypothetical protein [Muribaculaceae bacterium]
MKKFLLSLAVLAGFTAMAKEVTFDFINNDYGLERLSGSTYDYIDEGTSITSEGVTLTFSSVYGEDSKNESGCRLWSTNGFRMYNGGTITVTADEHISNVVINPEVSSIAITEGADAWTLAYTQTSKNGQFTTLTVTLGEAAIQDGSAAHPYLIATADDLCNAYKLTKAGEMVYFAQTEDIDMAGVTDYVCFVGGDNVTYSSQITYDGQNHLIKNFAPANGDAGDGLHAYCTSLFGVLNGTVKNLGVINVNIDSDQGCGVIAGYAGHSTGTFATVQNVFVTGKVKGSGYLGGIFGTSGNNVNIYNTFVNIELEGGANSAALVGRLRNELSLENVYTAGTVSSTSGALVIN